MRFLGLVAALAVLAVGWFGEQAFSAPAAGVSVTVKLPPARAPIARPGFDFRS
jgi:hypothetical protein